MHFDLGSVHISMDEGGNRHHEITILGVRLSSGTSTLQYLAEKLLVYTSTSVTIFQ